MLCRGAEQLIGRASGPLHFRLLVMPTVVAILTVRAGLRDAREGQPAFLWAILTNPGNRRRLFHSVVNDIGKIFIVATILDTAYQILFLRAFYIAQMFIVAVACSMVPYVLIREPITRRVFWPARSDRSLPDRRRRPETPWRCPRRSIDRWRSRQSTACGLESHHGFRLHRYCHDSISGLFEFFASSDQVCRAIISSSSVGST